MSDNKVETALVMAKEYPSLRVHQIVEGLDKLYRLAATSNRQAIQYANGELDSDEYEKSVERIEKHFDAINGQHFDGLLTYFHQSDPRGATLGVLLPSGKHNSWDGESWRFFRD